ncbi:MAG TPA: alanine--tRNA ligase-related protein, partial [Oscillospiraceae bacterium]|nr:alanine--tRNA ligase-related protein [Oscillospiraceae bacterium]
FKLYDTFGFPLDLTEDILIEKGITVDEEGFKVLMDNQKQMARSARASANGVSWVDDALSVLGSQKTKFVGYNRMDSAARILAILKDGELSEELYAGEEGVVVLDCTPFYAEMGGQVGDRHHLRRHFYLQRHRLQEVPDRAVYAHRRHGERHPA